MAISPPNDSLGNNARRGRPAQGSSGPTLGSPDHRFQVIQSPQPVAVVKTTKGQVPIDPYDTLGLPNKAAPIRDLPIGIRPK